MNWSIFPAGATVPTNDAAAQGPEDRRVHKQAPEISENVSQVKVTHYPTAASKACAALAKRTNEVAGAVEEIFASFVGADALAVIRPFQAIAGGRSHAAWCSPPPPASCSAVSGCAGFAPHRDAFLCFLWGGSMVKPAPSADAKRGEKIRDVLRDAFRGRTSIGR